KYRQDSANKCDDDDSKTIFINGQEFVFPDKKFRLICSGTFFVQPVVSIIHLGNNDRSKQTFFSRTNSPITEEDSHSNDDFVKKEKRFFQCANDFIHILGITFDQIMHTKTTAQFISTLTLDTEMLRNALEKCYATRIN